MEFDTYPENPADAGSWMQDLGCRILEGRPVNPITANSLFRRIDSLFAPKNSPFRSDRKFAWNAVTN
jgi:hypothetical protein